MSFLLLGRRDRKLFMNLKIIIPAAGYGKRMGSVSAKELLPHPNSGKPFLLEAIQKHQALQAPFHIISRKDKIELNEFIYSLKKGSTLHPGSILQQDFSPLSDPIDVPIELQCIEPSKEWPDTILQSKPYWTEWNLLVLPDADYHPLVTLKQLEEFQKSDAAYSVLFFTFNVENSSTWGMVRCATDFFEVVEKPQSTSNLMAKDKAWGLILFHKNIGEALFSALLESNVDHFWKRIEGKAHEISLDDFEDLTRVKGAK